MIIEHISDTHCYHENLLLFPYSGDLIIHSGDASNSKDINKNKPEFLEFVDWYSNLDYIHKIFVPGNHDTYFEYMYRSPIRKLEIEKLFSDKNIHLLVNSGVEIEGTTFWGSPYSPTFGSNWAFNCDRSSIHQYWDMIPSDTDVLITHGPPKYILDLCNDIRTYSHPFNAGCSSLHNKIVNTPNIKAHLFGHIHSNDKYVNHGVFTHHFKDREVQFSNGSMLIDGSTRDSKYFNVKPNIIKI